MWWNAKELWKNFVLYFKNYFESLILFVGFKTNENFYEELLFFLKTNSKKVFLLVTPNIQQHQVFAKYILQLPTNFCRVLYYRYKFLTEERFDNRFITKDFRTIDIRRAQLGKETVLPLNQRERNIYVNVNALLWFDFLIYFFFFLDRFHHCDSLRKKN